MLSALSAMGATAPQVSAAVVAMLVGYGVLSIALSIWLKMPVSIAWSTPGAAFLASSSALGLDFQTAVGAFLVASLLTIIAGLWPVLGEMVKKIPPQVSSAMLAGVIFPFVIATVNSAVQFPFLILPVILVWILLERVRPVLASPVAISLGFILIGLSPEVSTLNSNQFWPDLTIIVPNFELGAIVAIAIPLFLVTMASQNLPGLAIMSARGFELPTREMFVSTGAGGAITSFFGGFGLNLAALTAAINADESAGQDRSRRWIASAWGGAVYVLLAVFAVPFAAFVLAVPVNLLLALAGLALITTFSNAVKTAVSSENLRLTGIATFVVGASGITIYGIGGAFWALVVGTLLSLVSRERKDRY